MIKRAAQKAQGLSKKVVVGATGLVVAGTNAMAAGNITPPTADYTDIYALAGIAIGVSVVVLLIKKGKSFF